MFIDDEYDKIPEDVKNNGVSLLTTLIELKKKFIEIVHVNANLTSHIA